MLLAHEFSVALAAARAAADLIATHYRTEFSVEYKGADDPVTIADREANALIVSSLQQAFPHDSICAEEAASAESVRAAARGGRCWFVDPLDGTREFVDRNGEFCVMIGLSLDGAAALGVIVAPALQRAWGGIVGVGAWELHGDQRTALQLPAAMPGALPRTTASRSHSHPAVVRAAQSLGVTDTRRCGSVGLKVALVATGDVDLYLHAGAGPKLWDGCAPEAIARGAGALVTNARGEALRYHTDDLGLDQGLVVGHPAIHARGLAALQASLAGQSSYALDVSGVARVVGSSPS